MANKKGFITPVHTLVAAVVIAVVMALMVFHFADRPWMGLRMFYDKSAGGAVVSAARGPSAQIPIGTVLTKVASDKDELTLTELDFVAEPDGSMGTYKTYDEFLKRQERFARIQDSEQVIFQDSKGTEWKVRPVSERPLWTLPVEFWIQFVVGLLAWLISASVWALRPRESGVRYLLLNGFGMLISAQFAAVYTTRELAIHSELFWWIDGLNFFGGHLFISSLLALLLYYPRKLAPRWVGWAIISVYVIWYIAQDNGFFESMTDARRQLVMVGVFSSFALAGVHWFMTRKDPLARAALQWFLLSWLVATGIFSSMLFIPQLFGVDTSGLQSFGFTLFLLMYAGLAFGILKFRLFGLGEWWYRIVFWVLSMLLLVVLDLVFLFGLKLSNNLSLSAALLICGVFWFPLRGFLQSRLIPQTVSRTYTFKRVIDIALAPPGMHRTQLYIGLLKDYFNPLNMQAVNSSAQEVELLEHGQSLAVPSVVDLPAYRLEYAHGGQKLFSPKDVILVNELVDMIQHTVDSQNAYQKGVTEERQRVAQDLHDDVGARLLTGLHSDDTDLRATIRGAISDIRSIVKGIAGEGVPLADLFADLRSESAHRLGVVGIALSWPTEGYEKESLSVDYRRHKAIGSLLREVVSNTIRHSQAKHLEIAVSLAHDEIKFTFQDNGIGFPEGVLTGEMGFGLKGIKKRMQDLGGVCRVENSTKGASIYVTIPI